MACLLLCIRGLTITPLTAVSPLDLRREKAEKESYFASVRRHDEKRLDVVLLQEGVPLVAEARLHLVVAVQTLQGRPRDVHLAESTSTGEDGGAVSDKSQVLIIFISLTAPRFAQNSSQRRNFHPNDSFNLVASPKILLLHLKQDQIEPKT